MDRARTWLIDCREAVFFLLTNVLIVFGLVAFDNASAILQTFPSIFSHVPDLPSPILLVKSLLVPTSQYDQDRIEGMQEALSRLRKKSRSFYLASGVFQGRLRIDLILLYVISSHFCNVVANRSTGIRSVVSPTILSITPALPVKQDIGFYKCHGFWT